MKDLQNHIIKEFGSKITQKEYIQKSNDGLWLSEEILINKYFRKKSYILDLGCGTGRTTIPLHEKNFKVIGIDITPEMIRNAKLISKANKLDIKYEIGDATSLNFKDNTFDNALFSNNGWTQIPGESKRQMALKEIYRVLKPKGYFIFSAHVKKLKGFTFLWIKQWIKQYILKPIGYIIDEEEFGDRFFDRESGGTQYEQKQYIHIPSIKTVKRAILKSGFKLVYNEYGNRISGEKDYKPMLYVCQK